MTNEELYAHPGWQWCTAEGAELDVLLLGLRTPFREKLEWLEEMDELSQRFGQSRGAYPMAAPAAAALSDASVPHASGSPPASSDRSAEGEASVAERPGK